MQSQLEWSVLEIDAEEWERRVAGLNATPAADGPAHDPTPTGKIMSSRVAKAQRATWQHRRANLYWWALGGAGLVVVAALVGYGLWRTAEQGIARMQGDVTVAVHLETLKARTRLPSLDEHERVEAVEFRDGKAMAQVVVTQTLISGREVVQRRTHFYAQTPTGWLRTGPVAIFWGKPETLDTPSLHFTFGSKDRAAVEQIAPVVEAYYVALGRATGQRLVATGRLTVEVVPDHVAQGTEYTGGRLRLPSPVLFKLTVGRTDQELLTHMAQETLANQLLDMALRQMPVKQQWQPLVDGMSFWLAYSDALPLAPAADGADDRVQLRPSGLSRLNEMLGCAPCIDPSGQRSSDYGQHAQQSATIQQWIGFIVATYGIDVLPALLHGFGEYEDWETLAPVALGVSASELEAAWLDGVTASGVPALRARGGEKAKPSDKVSMFAFK